MIEVIVTTNGHTDRAEADTPENAMVAARTLWDEACDHWAGAFKGNVLFNVNGKPVAASIGRRP